MRLCPVRVPVETRVPKLIDEAVGKRLLHRLARHDVMPFDGEGLALGGGSLLEVNSVPLSANTIQAVHAAR